MLTSKDMYKRSQKSFFQSKNAFKAEMTMEPFFNAELHFNMFTTMGFHIARCAANIGLAFYCIPNTAAAVCKERDSIEATENGFSAIGHHLLAAVIDFANIFFTIGAIIARTFVTLGEGGYVANTLNSFFNYFNNAASAAASCLQQHMEYNAASALDFSPA